MCSVIWSQRQQSGRRPPLKVCTVFLNLAQPLNRPKISGSFMACYSLASELKGIQDSDLFSKGGLAPWSHRSLSGQWLSSSIGDKWKKEYTGLSRAAFRRPTRLITQLLLHQGKNKVKQYYRSFKKGNCFLFPQYFCFTPEHATVHYDWNLDVLLFHTLVLGKLLPMCSASTGTSSWVQIQEIRQEAQFLMATPLRWNSQHLCTSHHDQHNIYSASMDTSIIVCGFRLTSKESWRPAGDACKWPVHLAVASYWENETE